MMQAKGGFPALHVGDYSDEMAYKAVYDIYSSAILRDTIQRHGIRDVELLERVVKFVFDNVGNNFSAKSVADYFKSQNRRIDLNTVYNYLNALEGAFIIYRIPRYDVKGKEILKTNEKYFVGDQSLLYAVIPPLLAIKDNHPKYVVTMDENWHDNIEGIQHKHIADFILMKEY